MRIGLLLALSLCAGCPSSHGPMEPRPPAECGRHRVTLDLRSDFELGEVLSAEVRLDGEATLRTRFDPETRLREGVRLGTVCDVSRGAHRIEVVLLDPAGREVAARTVSAEVTRDISLTVAITRGSGECGGASCESMGCVRAECLDDRCVQSLDPAACPPGQRCEPTGECVDAGCECVDDAECPAFGCLVPECRSCACLSRPDDDRCGPGGACRPDGSCAGACLCASDADCFSAGGCARATCVDCVCLVEPDDAACPEGSLCDAETGECVADLAVVALLLRTDYVPFMEFDAVTHQVEGAAAVRVDVERLDTDALFDGVPTPFARVTLPARSEVLVTAWLERDGAPVARERLALRFPPGTHEAVFTISR